MPREWLTNTRQDWERRANEALERTGSQERIDRRSWAERREDAMKRGDLEEAARCSRRPNVHMGPGELRQRDGKEQKDQRVRRENEAAVTARDKIAEQIAAQQTVIAGIEQQLQRVDKAVLAQRALDVAARMVPVSKEERAVAQVVGKAIGKRLAKTGRSGGERGEPASSSPQQEPTPWERYQKRWPEQPEADRQLVEEIRREPDYWREQLEERFQRKLGWQKWDRTPGMEPTEPKPLPRTLAAEGKAEPGAAANEQVYTESLPEHYRQKWEKEGISTRAAAAEQQARTSLRAQVSLRPEKHVEAAVRKECGADAQRLDKEMREDMEQHRPRLAVLSRIDTMQSEEWRESVERYQRESLERARTRKPKSEQERNRGG